MTSSSPSIRSATSSPSSSPIAQPAKRSVQALLDELSDSDPEVNSLAPNVSRQPTVPLNQDEEDDESSEDDILLGGGRVARRLQAGADNHAGSNTHPEPEKKQDPGLAADQEDDISKSSSVAQPDSDAADFIPKRKLLLKRKRTATGDDGHVRPPPRRPTLISRPASQTSACPTSPSPPRRSSPAVATTTSPKHSGASKSKFIFLVEKARKERLAREEADKAKRAAREAEQTTSSPKSRRQRGSSPADSSEEESGKEQAAAAKRLTKDARPTRKASKKALEEMNRETQRMNRNMQLAHQATTKKKFTKESFFTSFSRGLTPVPEAVGPQQGRPLSSSSAPTSDNDNANLHSTPPTSPLQEPADRENATVSTQAVQATAPKDDSADELSLEDIFAARRTDAGKQNQVDKKNAERPAGSHIPNRGQVAAAIALNDCDSGSDLEVVFEKASKRKYSAFENLSKQRARTMPSHIALRSLANVKQKKDAKSTMARGDMGSVLLRAARQQAQEERREKIGKLKAAGIVIQTAEEREQDQEEFEDLVERARMEDEEIRKREKELAKKQGTYTKDALDEEDSDDEEDADFLDEQDPEVNSSSEQEIEDDDADVEEDEDNGLIDDAASETEDEEVTCAEDNSVDLSVVETPMPTRTQRKSRIILDDDDEEDAPSQIAESPALPSARRTPQSVMRSARKVIPGLQHSDDLPIGLTQAFAATMADSQTQEESATQEQDSVDILRDLPSPQIEFVPRLNRHDSLDMVTESIAGSQTKPMGLNLNLSQSQLVPESPAMPTEAFEPTQDGGFHFSPFAGNRFAETPCKGPYSTEETVFLQEAQESPVVRRHGKLQRGRQVDEDADEVQAAAPTAKSAFDKMGKAAKRKAVADFNKKRSEARQIVEEAAEESDDGYAGLGGASDEDSGEEENEDDRRMIDEDTQVGKGDEARLAKLHADRERQDDEAAVSKLMKDITTGALRRKRGAGDDLDLSDEEDAAARRREAKRREFAKMRREILKDEAVGKIAEDKKKEAFLKSLEDREGGDEDDDDFDQPEAPPDEDSQSQSQPVEGTATGSTSVNNASQSRPLQPVKESSLNATNFNPRRAKALASRRPGTLAEIRESVTFLTEEPDSQAATIDFGLSDSEEELEAFVNLDRHLQQAEADEAAMDDENEDLGDFTVDDESRPVQEEAIFKKPDLPTKGDRVPFSERRTKSTNVVDRLSLLKQASSSSIGLNNSSKMAFFTSKAGSGNLSNAPSLLRRATTNSSMGSVAGQNMSATGVVTNKTERGSAAHEKEFVRKGSNTSRNAINYQGRQNLKEEKMSARAGIVKKQQQKKTGGSGFLSGLLRGDTWS